MLEQPGFWIAIIGASAMLVALFLMVRKIERDRRQKEQDRLRQGKG